MIRTGEQLKISLYLGLGSNLGNRRENLIQAVSRLDAAFGRSYAALSDFIETEPWGFESPDKFLNGVVCYDLDVPRGTTYESIREFAHGILKICKQIEMEMGRTEDPEFAVDGTRIYHSRIIDIDILLLGGFIIDDPDLKIPHPLMTQRDFVMIPLNSLLNRNGE